MLSRNFAAVAASHLTLSRGCAFWIENASLPPLRTSQARAVFARLSGNRLRELDGFLNHLLADILAAISAPPDNALQGERAKSTLRRLHAVEAHLNLNFDVEVRLIALARTITALRRPAGQTHLQRFHRDLQVATGLPQNSELRFPEALDDAAVLSICSFYQLLGNSLVIAHANHANRG